MYARCADTLRLDGRDQVRPAQVVPIAGAQLQRRLLQQGESPAAWKQSSIGLDGAWSRFPNPFPGSADVHFVVEDPLRSFHNSDGGAVGESGSVVPLPSDGQGSDRPTRRPVPGQPPRLWACGPLSFPASWRP